MDYGWIDGKRVSDKSEDWMWTDGSVMCQLENVVDELQVIGKAGNVCLQLGIFKLADNWQPNSRLKAGDCNMKMSYLCKKEIKPCLPDPGLPCNIPEFKDDRSS